MARCYLTGVEFPISNGFVFNLAAANQALRNLNRKIEEIQRLIDQLGRYDAVEIYHKPLNKKITRRHRRLICPSVADALAAVCPEGNLFLSWLEYRHRSQMFHGNGPAMVANREGEE